MVFGRCYLQRPSRPVVARVAFAAVEDVVVVAAFSGLVPTPDASRRTTPVSAPFDPFEAEVARWGTNAAPEPDYIAVVAAIAVVVAVVVASCAFRALWRCWRDTLDVAKDPCCSNVPVAAHSAEFAA